MEISHFEKVYFLEQCSALSGSAPHILDVLAGEATAAKMPRGTVILNEGDPVDGLYTVAFGELAISVGESRVASAKAGDLLGDHEVLTGRANSGATVRVESSYAWLLRIPRLTLTDLFRREPRVLSRFASSLGRRQENMRAQVAEWKGISARLKRELNRLEESLDSVQQIARQEEDGSNVTIELRYRVSLDESQLADSRHRKLKQGYLALSESEEIRIRDDGGEHTITGKRSYGRERVEIELPLSPALFEALDEFTAERILIKKRFSLDHRGHTWRVDVFEADTACEGLIIAEVDVRRGEEVPEPPALMTILEDISDDERYRNKCLAENGPPVGE